MAQSKSVSLKCRFHLVVSTILGVGSGSWGQRCLCTQLRAPLHKLQKWTEPATMQFSPLWPRCPAQCRRLGRRWEDIQRMNWINEQVNLGAAKTLHHCASLVLHARMCWTIASSLPLGRIRIGVLWLNVQCSIIMTGVRMGREGPIQPLKCAKFYLMCGFLPNFNFYFILPRAKIHGQLASHDLLDPSQTCGLGPQEGLWITKKHVYFSCLLKPGFRTVMNVLLPETSLSKMVDKSMEQFFFGLDLEVKHCMLRCSSQGPWTSAPCPTRREKPAWPEGRAVVFNQDVFRTETGLHLWFTFQIGPFIPQVLIFRALQNIIPLQ